MPVIACTTTAPEQLHNYLAWLHAIRKDVEVRIVQSEEGLRHLLSDAHGLLLPGGGDPDPLLYGRDDARELCSVDALRDSIELSAIEFALLKKLPILGICRGLQIANVAFGGALLPDLPSAGYDAHHCIDGNDRQHDIVIERDSALARISGQTSAVVNSAHHQGLRDPAECLRVTARSADGLAEALEWAEPGDKPFLLLLHWHPERLAPGHPLRDCPGRAFLDACANNALRE
jgi:putative glutamine amidotransferase